MIRKVLERWSFFRELAQHKQETDVINKIEQLKSTLKDIDKYDYDVEYNSDKVSDGAQLIIDSKPFGWEIRLYAQVIKDEVDANTRYHNLFEKNQNDIVENFEGIEDLDDTEDILNILAEASNDFNQARTITEKMFDNFEKMKTCLGHVAEAIGESGQDGDPSLIIKVAKELSSHHRRFIIDAVKVEEILRKYNFNESLPLFHEFISPIQDSFQLYGKNLLYQTEIAEFQAKENDEPYEIPGGILEVGFNTRTLDRFKEAGYRDFDRLQKSGFSRNEAIRQSQFYEEYSAIENEKMEPHGIVATGFHKQIHDGAGFVYLLTNPSYKKGLVKLGKTTRDPNERAKELSSSTGVPTPFDVLYAILVTDCSEAERYIHNRLREDRVDTNREFFEVSTTKAINVMIEAKEKYKFPSEQSYRDYLNQDERYIIFEEFIDK